ncbi:hypothetical protein MLD38_004464 [Melastoma candidum]|uniref:Uncharacterized protein n=1 Tax=Melastoma candidum TaxID=119954 RepID=A0ACB9S734_9MYRT|nr:hypothetical protein MLD38_004464 [Melastoma candidum]
MVDVVVLMVPLPAQGHINQLLQLSSLIASTYPDIPIHFAAASSHNNQALLRSSAAPTANIFFHDLSAPPFPCPPPNPNSSHKFPSHLIPAFRHANVHLLEPISALIRFLSSSARRLVVINDSLMASTIRESFSLPNTESYTFHSVSAFTIHWFITAEDKNELLRCYTPDFLEFARSQYEFKRQTAGIIFNTCRAIEGTYIDKLNNQSSWKHWPLGPFNPLKLSPVAHRSPCRCMEWLDRQEQRSVLYISFGTTTTFTSDQLRELAIGLEKSSHKFLWVLREADTGDIFSQGKVSKIELPDGYEERVESSGTGMVLREWAPQLEILGHGSTGGFMSHCGWNSCMESISMGVPVAAWPIHSDQIKNAELLTSVLRVGIHVQNKDETSRDGLVSSEAIERAVIELMGSEERRRRATELGVEVRKCWVSGGGDSRAELDPFITHISR